MNHIDLFSGIGGFALAAREVWGEDYHNVFFCDNNNFCREVIKKNFGKDSVIYGDIREITRERVIADTDRARSRTPSSGINRNGSQKNKGRQEQPQLEFSGCDLLTGGFPCQPFSQAGKRRGTEDNRYLWPEMLRVIKDFSPRWVIAENVRGLINISNGVVFEQVCLDLEAVGYEVQAFIIPAVAVNAPHRRDRVWFVAHRNEWSGRPRNESKSGITTYEKSCSKDTNNHAPDTSDKGLERWGEQGQGLSGQQDRDGSNERREWKQNWLEVATKFCGMDDGLPAELDGLKLSKARHRVERLKALGNAIVPQVAMEIMRGIKDSDE